jgi:uncharacterized iron-regulated membrane protein
MSAATTNIGDGALYRTLWRWHFYAGLMVMPLILLLSVTGSLFLFKPQVERWEERAFQGLPTTNAASPAAQVDAALASALGSRFHSYRLPERPGDAAMIHLALPDGQSMRDIFVSPQGRVLGSIDPETRIIAIDRRIHGQLLLGRKGSWIVELAASWAIVMILSGLYLWWPRGRGLAGVVWPRLGLGKRTFWRDIHAVTGFWVSGLALILLVTGLPWADAWGTAFKAARTELGLVKGKQDWTIGGHADHDHAAMLHMEASGAALPSLNHIVGKAQREHLPFPVLVTPPGDDMLWTVKSDIQNRPQQVTLRYDMATGRLVSRTGFAAKHPVDRIIGYGIAWHEGQLFGWINQLIGLLTAAMLTTLVVSGTVMWWRRRPQGTLGAPIPPRAPARMRGVAAIMLLLALLLPLFAASLFALWLIERLALPRLPGVSRWLGLYRQTTASKNL